MKESLTLMASAISYVKVRIVDCGSRSGVDNFKVSRFDRFPNLSSSSDLYSISSVSLDSIEIITCANLLGCIESKSIVLDPDYQREVVWDEGRAALLITSILSTFNAPTIRMKCIELYSGLLYSAHHLQCQENNFQG